MRLSSTGALEYPAEAIIAETLGHDAEAAPLRTYVILDLVAGMAEGHIGIPS